MSGVSNCKKMVPFASMEQEEASRTGGWGLRWVQIWIYWGWIPLRYSNEYLQYNYDMQLRKKKTLEKIVNIFKNHLKQSIKPGRWVSYKETIEGKKIRLEPSATSARRKLKSNTWEKRIMGRMYGNRNQRNRAFQEGENGDKCQEQEPEVK